MWGYPIDPRYTWKQKLPWLFLVLCLSSDSVILVVSSVCPHLTTSFFRRKHTLCCKYDTVQRLWYVWNAQASPLDNEFELISFFRTCLPCTGSRVQSNRVTQHKMVIGHHIWPVSVAQNFEKGKPFPAIKLLANFTLDVCVAVNEDHPLHRFAPLGLWKHNGNSLASKGCHIPKRKRSMDRVETLPSSFAVGTVDPCGARGATPLVGPLRRMHKWIRLPRAIIKNLGFWKPWHSQDVLVEWAMALELKNCKRGFTYTATPNMTLWMKKSFCSQAISSDKIAWKRWHDLFPLYVQAIPRHSASNSLSLVEDGWKIFQQLEYNPSPFPRSTVLQRNSETAL